MPNNITLPRLIIFGLENAICTGVLSSNHLPFNRNKRNNQIYDCVGNELHYYTEVHELFETLNEKGVGIAFIFKCEAFAGKEFLEKSQLDKYILDGAKWWEDIYGFDRCKHECGWLWKNRDYGKPEQVRRIHEKTYIPYSEILLFDGNISFVQAEERKTGLVGYEIPKKMKGELNLTAITGVGIKKYILMQKKYAQIYSETSTSDTRTCWKQLKAIIRQES